MVEMQRWVRRVDDTPTGTATTHLSTRLESHPPLDTFGRPEGLCANPRYSAPEVVEGARPHNALTSSR